MRIAARKEMEYLGNRGRDREDEGLIQELGRRLDALRRYDQCIFPLPTGDREHRGNGNARIQRLDHQSRLLHARQLQ